MEKDRNELIGERVRHYRTAKSMSQEQLASGLSRKITPQQIALLETGQSRWFAADLCEVADMLRVGVNLLCGTEEKRYERTGSVEWEAEKYKTKLLLLKNKPRLLLYKIIDAIIESNF